MTAVPAGTNRGVSGISQRDVALLASKPVIGGPDVVTITPLDVVTREIPAAPVRVAATPPPADNQIVASKNPKLNLLFHRWII